MMSLHVIREWARWCDAVYRPKDMANLLYSLGFDPVTIDHSPSGVQAISWTTDTDQNLVFCGSNAPQDWAANLDAFGHDYGDWKVHRGIYLALLQVLPVIQARRQPDLPLRLAGHSLGGALAALLALQLAGKVDTLVTFGQPRVMSRGAARFLDSRLGDNYVRVVNNNDVVPRLPPGYAHGGRELYIDSRGIPHWNGRVESMKWFRRMDKLRGRLASLGRPVADGLADHPCIQYRRAFNAY